MLSCARAERARWHNRRVRARPRSLYAGLALASLLLPACTGPAADTATAREARAEIQINLCAPPEAIVRALALQPDGAGPREAWYFESANLAHHRGGAVFRLRLGARERELTLKVADQDCARIDRALLPPAEGKCEYDLHGADFKGAVSLSRELDEPAVRDLLDGRMPLADALSPAQVRYLREGASAWPLAPDIRRLGPVRIEAYRPVDRSFVVELWQLPGGERYAEISQKTTAAEALGRRPALEATLARAGVTACADQSSQAADKLRTMLR